MLTNVAPTSIEAYHDPTVKASISNQRQRVAARVIEQTKRGAPSCIASLYDHFNKIGDKALSQKSSVSRACNEIAGLCETEGCIEVEGRKYQFQEVAPRKYAGHMAKHFCLALVQTEEAGRQVELF
jgi:hypothetical protein